MKNSKLRPPLLVGLLFIVAFAAAWPSFPLIRARSEKRSNPTVGGPDDPVEVMVKQAVKFAESAPLSDLVVAQTDPAKAARMARSIVEGGMNQLDELPIRNRVAGAISTHDPVIQSIIISGLSLVTNPIVNFNGIEMDSLALILMGRRFAPPSSSADVGPNHVMMTVNTAFQVYDKSGMSLTPVARLNNLFAALGPPYNNLGAGEELDPIVLYDPLADRWLINQFTLISEKSHQLVAISKTNDPTGQYFTYAFEMPSGRLTADPRLGVWTDAYYMSTNDFTSTGSAFLGAGFHAYERTKMLAGDPAALIISLITVPTNGGGFLPADIDGVLTPPVGTPNLFMRFEADEFSAPTDVLRIVEFRPNFANPQASTLIQLTDIPTAPFDARNPPGRTDIEQPPPAGQADSLEAIADRLMHRLGYRTLPGGAQSYILNYTVNVSGENPTGASTYQGGIRWMEMRRNATSGTVTINQQATYAPGAGNGATGRNLWMARVAQDAEGNIGLAANASSTTLNPTAIYTGRLANDPVNTLPQGEIDALAAVTKGVQIGTSNRWGNYNSLSVDPSDECTFWGAYAYVDAPTASFDWNTRIFSFKVNPNCVSPAKGVIQGTITDCVTRQPIANAEIRTPEGYFRQNDATGHYTMTVAPGTYTVTVTKPGFSPTTGAVTVVGPNQTAIYSTCLTNCPAITVNPASLPAGTVSAAYSQTLTASAGITPHTFNQSAGRLPDGLGLSSGGVLSGTPTAVGTFTFTIRVTDANGCTGERMYTLTVASAGLEGDVDGDGFLTSIDKTRSLFMTAGLEINFFADEFQVNLGNEFQRADSAPRNSKGDGLLNLPDAVQTGRYVANLDPATSAGGPLVPSSGSLQYSSAQTTAWRGGAANQTRMLRAVNASFVAGQINTLDIELNALGGENAAAFTLNFDPSALTFVSAAVGSANSSAELAINSTQAASGIVGVVVALPAGQGLQAGARRIVTVRFNVAAGTTAITTPVSFGAQIVEPQLANINADELAVTTAAAAVTITRTVASVSAASFSGTTIATESIVAAFGQLLATNTEVAATVPLPTTLAGTTVRIRDNAGIERSAQLFFVAPGQINFYIPPGTAQGTAQITITSGDGAISVGSLNIALVAPGFFTANSDGQGVPAASAFRVKADGTQIESPVAVFDPALGRFVVSPIDLGPEMGAATDQVFLILYGTGWRFRGNLSAVTCSIGGVNAEVLFADAQGSFVGLDQMNVRLPRSLIGRGEIDLTVMVDGKPSNTVKISVK